MKRNQIVKKIFFEIINILDQIIKFISILLMKKFLIKFSIWSFFAAFTPDTYCINAPQRLEIEEIYGEVEYFITYKYNELDYMFAYIHKINKYKENNYEQIYFSKFDDFQFIEVIDINRCIRFFKIRNLFYI